jgi:hypothetical protein
MTENQKNGICPLISKVVIKPGVASGVIDMPHGQSASVVETGILAVPCAGPECQLWDGYNNVCSLKSLPFLVSSIENITARPRADMHQKPGNEMLDAIRGIGESLAELTHRMATSKKRR